MTASRSSRDSQFHVDTVLPFPLGHYPHVIQKSIEPIALQKIQDDGCSIQVESQVRIAITRFGFGTKLRKRYYGSASTLVGQHQIVDERIILVRGSEAADHTSLTHHHIQSIIMLDTALIQGIGRILSLSIQRDSLVAWWDTQPLVHVFCDILNGITNH